MVQALILKRSGLGLLMGKFCQCLTELSVHNTIMAGYYSLTFLFSDRFLHENSEAFPINTCTYHICFCGEIRKISVFFRYKNLIWSFDITKKTWMS